MSRRGALAAPLLEHSSRNACFRNFLSFRMARKKNSKAGRLFRNQRPGAKKNFSGADRSRIPVAALSCIGIRSNNAKQAQNVSDVRFCFLAMLCRRVQSHRKKIAGRRFYRPLARGCATIFTISLSVGRNDVSKAFSLKHAFSGISALRKGQRLSLH